MICRSGEVNLLALTSNIGAFDFQTQLINGKEVYKTVIETSKTWKNAENLMYVVGATKAEMLSEVREIVPTHFLLVPGVGAQGGSIADVCKYGLIKNDIGLIINMSRSVIYASNGEDFAEAAANEAKKVSLELSAYVK